MNVVWDLGAVLLRWRPATLLARLLPQRVADQADALRWSEDFFRNGGDWHQFDRGVLGVPELVERIARRTGLHVGEVRKVVDAVPAELEPITHSVAVLDRLHAAGHRQYYLSNMPGPYARHLLARHRFFRRFRSGVFSSCVQLIKPEPAIFALAQREFGIAGEPVLFIDDTAANVAAAGTLGWTGLHCTDPAALSQQIERLGLL